MRSALFTAAMPISAARTTTRRCSGGSPSESRSMSRPTSGVSIVLGRRCVFPAPLGAPRNRLPRWARTARVALLPGAVVAFYPATAALALAASRRPVVAPAALLTDLCRGIGLGLLRRRSRQRGCLTRLVTPIYGLAHGLGMWRGLFTISATDRSPEPPFDDSSDVGPRDGETVGRSGRLPGRIRRALHRATAGPARPVRRPTPGSNRRARGPYSRSRRPAGRGLAHVEPPAFADRSRDENCARPSRSSSSLAFQDVRETPHRAAHQREAPPTGARHRSSRVARRDNARRARGTLRSRPRAASSQPADRGRRRWARPPSPVAAPDEGRLPPE